MAGQVQLKEMTPQERKQDCGCGCGGALCGATHQEVVWVGFGKPVALKEGKAGQCNCGCGCEACN